MPQFSDKSMAKLETCHEQIQAVMLEAIKRGPDFSIVCGHRSSEEQQKLYAQGRTEPGEIVTHVDGVTKFSMHNHSPSLAVDIIPYPTGYSDRQRFVILGSYVLGVAHTLGANLHWGADWDADWDMKEHPFVDLPHFELRG